MITFAIVMKFEWDNEYEEIQHHSHLPTLLRILVQS